MTIKNELHSYQKEIYEMILNYKIYSGQFDSINENLKIILYKKSLKIKVCIFLYINLNIIMIVFIGALVYIYIFFFENIIIKILNYLNMIMNVKNSGFKFDEMFTRKLDNLETIIQLYNVDPI